MMSSPLAAAWLTLMGLSIATVLVTADGGAVFGQVVFGGLLLLLAWAKARVILSRYLGLWQAPGWLSGFSRVTGLFCLLLLCLYVVPVFNP
jgi:nitric oxide reductase NorF protein